MRAPRLALVAGAAALIFLVSAAAASLPTTSGTLGAGIASVTACDGDGFTFRYTLDTTGHITTVTVSSIASACAGGTLRVTLTNGTTSVGSGSASLPSSGFSGTATVTVSPTPLSTQVTAAYSAVEGP
jgi:hypothetical protein